MNTFLVSVAQLNGVSIGSLAIYVVIAAAIIALLFVALRQFGIPVPPWVVQIGWILIVAFVVILAIRFVMTM